MNRNSTVDKMVAYMNEKYDDHFEYSAPFGGGPGAASKQIIVSSEKYPEAQVWVQYYERDGKAIFADNYVAYKYEEQTKVFLETLLGEVFSGEVKLQYEVGTTGTVHDFTEDTSFEDYASSPASQIGFRAFLFDDGSAVSLAENDLKQALERSGFVISGSVFVTDDADRFDAAFDLPAREHSKAAQLQIIMDGPGSFLMYEWR